MFRFYIINQHKAANNRKEEDGISQIEMQKLWHAFVICLIYFEINLHFVDVDVVELLAFNFV